MFWNLEANEIKSEEWQPNVHLQAFADDFIFVISEPTGAKLKATAQAALTKFQFVLTNTNSSTRPQHLHGRLKDRRQSRQRFLCEGRRHNEIRMDDATSSLQHSLPSRSFCYTGGLSLGKSSLYSIASIDTKSPIAQQTQEIILKPTNIKLG
ncbi:hypothetical protein AVEN_196379-1 [Araneus ventricosus]|uniref:Reverse transcriptase domain-containing protein n=1 Tax=Araneus ventricosus TaxID=182803 RepID=A0A4Y2AWS6_ARAVE|nr:hypothetical protein AVEN_196379-1 [Araneus ventricosus]